MTLKEECIDILKLISEPLNARNDLYDYEVETDEYVQFCDRNTKIENLCDCYDCEICNEEKCNHKQYIKVDISFHSYIQDVYHYIVFGSVPQDKRLKKSIHYINNHSQLMDLVKYIKEEIEKSVVAYSEFAEKCEDLKCYAKEFHEIIHKDFFFVRTIDFDTVPFMFHFGYRKDHNWGDNTFVSGDFKQYGSQSTINIYDVLEEDMEHLKKTIRHEMIHYYLALSNCKYQDDSAIFHVLCNKYDAHAYMDMPEEQQKLFDMVIFGIRYRKSKLNEIVRKELNLPHQSVELLESFYLYAIGVVDDEDSMKSFFMDELEKYYSIKDKLEKEMLEVA